MDAGCGVSPRTLSRKKGMLWARKRGSSSCSPRSMNPNILALAPRNSGTCGSGTTCVVMGCVRMQWQCVVRYQVEGHGDWSTLQVGLLHRMQQSPVIVHPLVPRHPASAECRWRAVCTRCCAMHATRDTHQYMTGPLDMGVSFNTLMRLGFTKVVAWGLLGAAPSRLSAALFAGMMWLCRLDGDAK
jgi:hypothetical protein